MKHEINHLHERCLRMVFSGKTSSFKKYLEKNKSVPIHIGNLQILATEFWQESKDLVPTTFGEFFSKQSVQYDLRHASEFYVSNVKSTSDITKSLSYLGPNIWNLLPKEHKEISRSSEACAFEKTTTKW